MRLALSIIALALAAWALRLEVIPLPHRDQAGWAVVHNRWTGQVWRCLDQFCIEVDFQEPLPPKSGSGFRSINPEPPDPPAK